MSKLSWFVRRSGRAPWRDHRCRACAEMGSHRSPFWSLRPVLLNWKGNKISQQFSPHMLQMFAVHRRHWKMNWCQENEKSVKTSHPNLSAVTEDIRFNLQPVSISKFTSCPKHCIHRGGACKIGEIRKKKILLTNNSRIFCAWKEFLSSPTSTHLAGHEDEVILLILLWIYMAVAQTNLSIAWCYSRHVYPASAQLCLQ